MPNASMADDVADLLDAQSWAGWSVFVNEMPPDPDQAIGVFLAGGAPPEARIDATHPAVQIRVRAAKHDWPTASAKLKECFDLLHKRTGTLTGTYYVQILAAGDALPMGLDKNERPELVQTFDAMRSR